jgi:hypothetical protein
MESSEFKNAEVKRQMEMAAKLMGKTLEEMVDFLIEHGWDPRSQTSVLRSSQTDWQRT